MIESYTQREGPALAAVLREDVTPSSRFIDDSRTVKRLEGTRAQTLLTRVKATTALHTSADRHTPSHLSQCNAHEGPASPTCRVAGHLCRPEARSERDDPPSPRAAHGLLHQAPTRGGWHGPHEEMLRRPRARPRARPVGPWHQRPNGAPTPQRASTVSHAGSLTGSSRTGWPDAEARLVAKLRPVRTAGKPPRAPGRLLYQPAPEERLESVNAAHPRSMRAPVANRRRQQL